MADSESDQFESADEEFSGESDTESPKPTKSFNETKSPAVTNDCSLPETYVTSALQNLVLQDSNVSTESFLAEGKQNVCISEKILDFTNTETSKHSNFYEGSSPAEVATCPMDGSSSTSTGSLRPGKDLTEITSLKSATVNEDTVGIKTNIKLSFDLSKSDSSNSKPFSSCQSKTSFEVSKTTPESAFKSPSHQEPLPSSSGINIDFEKDSVISPDNNEAEAAWTDGWEEDATFETDVNTQLPSESLPLASLEPSKIDSKKDSSNASLSNHSWKMKDIQNEEREKKLKSPVSQPALAISETAIDSKSRMKSKEENIGESSWNDGWEEDFEIEDASVDDVKAEVNKKEIVSDSGFIGDNEDSWNDGWDTEEVTHSSELSKNLVKGEVQVPDPKRPVTKNETGTTVERVDKGVTKKSDILMPDRPTINKQVLAQQQQQQHQDGWFGWGVTNILSSATEGLSSITSNVTSAFESTIGAPDPKEVLLAQKEQETEPSEAASEAPNSKDGSGLSSNLFSVSSWTKFVESTSSKVLTTGLDTLETIGKKTMEVLQEGDPGLKNKRAKLREFVSEPGKPVLSQVLREAKERAETSSRRNEAALIEIRANFEILFDDFEGLVHLEALEMISKQCQIKLDSLALTFSGKEAKNFKETLQEVEELCELPEDDENFSKQAMADSNKFKLTVSKVLAGLDIDIQYTKLLETSELVENRLTKDYTNPVELHQIAISSLAEISAAAMLVFHRAAEMLVIKQKHSTIAETDSLMSFGASVCSKLQVTADKFSSKLTTIDPSDNTKVSHIAKEAVNSITYTQTACQLLVPILQYGAAV